MDFRDILDKHGIDSSKVMVMRHSPTEPELRRVIPWLASDRPAVYNAYQQIQNPDAEKALAKAEFVASFIGCENRNALFVGLYRRGESRAITDAEFRMIPEIIELAHFGIVGIEHRSTALWFDLELLSDLSEWKGRILVKWPPGRSWWRWAKSNTFLLQAIHEDSRLDAEIPSWNELVLSWENLKVLPAKWKTIIGQWRGIYFIFDISDGKGYVGSACGSENILGRWVNYADSGHGGNKLLKQRNPSGFRFSILQLTAPDADKDGVIRLEATWKVRLHTREHGLNDN